MFNKWVILFLITLILLKVSFFFFNKVHVFFIISEVIWITLFTIYCFISSTFNDPRYFVFSFFFLFIAVIEIILFSITFNK